MICAQCHSPNPDDASACSFCGAERAVTRITNIAGLGDDSASLVSAVEKREARKIAGRYVLLSFLGRGSAGVVFRALDEKLGEEVALKVLLPGLTADPGEIARLKREVVTARKITHPNVIRLHDFGEEGGSAFLSMELLTGGTLYERIVRAPPTPAEAVELAIGIAEGLGAAHRQDVVHRDVKPQNVLLDARGVVKLADFGLARLTVATTRTVGFAGTPQYMSPETIDDKPSTPRSDVYSLGVLLFELLTGRLPFTAETLIRLALMHMNDPPPRPSSLRDGIPAVIDDVVLRALEKDPLRRFADGDEMAAALRAVRRDEFTVASRTGSADLAPAETPVEAPTIPPAPIESTTVSATLRPVAVTAPLVARPTPPAESPTPEPSVRRKIFAERSDSLAGAEAARRRVALRWSVALGVVFTAVLWVTLSPPWQTHAAPSPTPALSVATPLAIVTPPPGTATLVLHAWPKVEISVDGEKIAETAVLAPTEVVAGDHLVSVRSDAHHFGMEKKVHFEPGRETFIRVDQRDGAFEVTAR